MHTKNYISNRLIYETTSKIELIEYWSDDESDYQSKKHEVGSLASLETYEKTPDEKDSDEINTDEDE